MIARNFRKYPDAMALQLPIPFAHLLVWATARPGVRVLRTIRAARAAAFKAAGRTRQVIKAKTPTWYAEATKRARSLAKSIKAACLNLALERNAAKPCAFQPGKGSPFDGKPCPICRQVHHYQP